jgi:hypothetical protein
MLETLTHTSFAPHLNTTFWLHPDEPAAYVTAVSGAAPVALKLTHVIASGADPAANGRAPFELLFFAVDRAIWPQRVYTLSHPALGQLDLFLVPVGTDARGVTYQVIFS